MREGRVTEREEYLLDDDDDDTSSSCSEPGDCNWVVIVGIFIIQLVVSGVLASYGVLLVSLVEETGVTLGEALWTPIVYTVSWCMADPVCKKISDKREGQSSRLLAVVGIVVAAGGIATTPLLYSSGLQVVGYGLVGGLGTSLVLTQAEIILHCHYPRRNRVAGLPHCIPQLGSALAHFAMPLVLLGFISAYGFHGAPLLQAGLVLQGLLGAVTFVPPAQRAPATTRYSTRPRTYTFVEEERESVVRRDSYINDSYTGGGPLVSSSSCRTWKNPASSDESPEVKNSNCNPLPVYELVSSRCNKNQYGVDILPEIPEESEDCDDSDYNTSVDIHIDASTTVSAVNFTDIPLNTATRSVDNHLDADKANGISDESVENKRWSIGTLEEMMPICLENGLSHGQVLRKKNSNVGLDDRISNKFEGDIKEFTVSEEMAVGKQNIRSRANTFPLNSALWSTRSSGEVVFSSNKKDVSEFDPILSNSESSSLHGAKNMVPSWRKVRSLDDVPVFRNTETLIQSDSPRRNIVLTKIKSVDSNSLDEVVLVQECEENTVPKTKNTPEQINYREVTDESKRGRKRRSLGSLEEIVSVNGELNSKDIKAKEIDNYRKWHSDEIENSNKSNFPQKLTPSDRYSFELQEVRGSVENSSEHDNCQEAEETGSSSQGSGDSEQPLWTAKLVSSDTVETISGSCQESESLRHWNRRSSMSRTWRRLKDCCSCRSFGRYSFRRRYPRSRYVIKLWPFLECINIPYFFPSLLLRFALRLCPMGFAALTPSLAKKVIDGCTNEEAVFSVSVSGFVWLCFLLVTPWCSKMPPSKKKYLFAAGNIVAAYGLHLLSRAESHDKITLSCAIFGLGQGAAMVTGDTVMRETLGTWNLAKVDVILDLISGALVLAAATLMGFILKDQEGLPTCFTIMAVIYLVTGIVWLLRPLLTSLRCQLHVHDWSTSGGHLLTSG